MNGTSSALFLFVITSIVPCYAAEVPQFTTPVAVAELNTPGHEGKLWLSDNGLTAYFESDKGDSPYHAHIFKTTRTSLDTLFSTPTEVFEINRGPRQLGPFVSRDGLTMYFSCHYDNRLIDYPTIWQISRSSVDADWDTRTQKPVPGINTLQGGESNVDPFITDDGLTMYFQRRFPGTAPDLYVFASKRPGGLGNMDLYVAVRDSVVQPFGEPVNLSILNSPDNDSKCFFHEPTQTIYSTRKVEGTGVADLYSARIMPANSNAWQEYK